jgi:hypothetical protein
MNKSTKTKSSFIFIGCKVQKKYEKQPVFLILSNIIKNVKRCITTLYLKLGWQTKRTDIDNESK